MWIFAATATTIVFADLCFAFDTNNEELFGRLNHWIRPLLILSAIAWFALAMMALEELAK